MTAIKRVMMAAAGQGGDPVYVEDVFSTWLYKGNSSTQVITNGLDLDEFGGLVWGKSRTLTARHTLTDTVRGATNALGSNITNGTVVDPAGVTSFSSTGFTVGNDSNYNNSSHYYASWTFRKEAGFFDIVTYTGTGSAHAIDHALGSTPGCIFVKNLSAADDWKVYHKSNTANPETDYLVLNTTAATVDDATVWNDTAPTATQFTVGTHSDVNTSGEDYVAYIFADDDESFGVAGNESIIKCGSYTGDGAAAGQQISLGWEPQYVLWKPTNVAAIWNVYDIMRGWDVGGNDQYLFLNTTNPESDLENGSPNADGMLMLGNNSNISARDYVYIAIRRPMKVPESASEVFAIDQGDGTGGSGVNAFTSGFPVDWGFFKSNSVQSWVTSTRLTQGKDLNFDVTDAEGSASAMAFDYMDGWYNNARTTAFYSWMFKRAPEFMDVVAYTGTGSAHTEAHGLAVTPELIIIKNRDAADAWAVYNSTVDETDYLVLNTTAAVVDDATFWNDTAPTSSVFTVGTNVAVNTSAESFIAYLFATLAGVSKVGSYTGTAATLTIDCGFAAGSSFILIKRTDATGGWYLWDSVRGIIAGDDPYFLLNSTAAEVTDKDWIDPHASGFQLSNEASNLVNVDGSEYIFLAIAAI